MEQIQASNIQVYTFELDTGFDLILNRSNDVNISDGSIRYDMSQYGEYRASKQLWRYMAPVILAVGTIGSVLSLIVLCRKSLRTQTTMFYLSALAIADLMVLYAGLVRLWLEHAENTYIRLTSSTACKIHNFFVYLSLDLSVWILVAVSVDRCLYVSWPASARRWCTLVNARIFVIIILCMSALVNMHFFWTYDLELYGSQQIYANGGKKCYASTSSSLTVSFIENVWPWIDFCIYCLCPFLFMAASNAIIIKQLVRTDRNMASYHKVVLDGVKRAVPKGEFDQQARSPMRMASTSKCGCKRSRARSDKDCSVCGTFREVMEIKPLKVPATANDCFPQRVSVDDDQLTIRNDVVINIDDSLALHFEDVGAIGRAREDVIPNCVNHEVVNIKRIDLDICGGSLTSAYLTNEDTNMEMMPPQGQGHQWTQADIISADTEETCSQEIDQPLAEIRSSVQAFGICVDINRAGSQTALPVSREAQFDELTYNIDPSNCATTSLQHRHINVVAANVASFDGVKHVHASGVGETNLISETCPCGMHERLDNTSSVDDDSSKSSEACASPWSTQISNRDLELNMRTDSRKQICCKLFDKRKIKCHNSQTGSDSCSFERSMSSDPCLKEDEVSTASAVSVLQISDNAANKLKHESDSRNGVELGSADRTTCSESKIVQTINPGTERQTSTSSRRNTSSVSKTLLTVTIMFWVFNAPIVIFIIGHTYFAASADGRGQALIILGWAIVNILQYMNNALHFFLYCLTGPKFRQELRDMLGEWILMVNTWRNRRLTK